MKIQNKSLIPWPAITIIFFLFCVSSLKPDQNAPLTVSNNKKGLWSDTKNIEFEQDFIIGKEYGQKSDMFSYIRDIAFDLLDNLYVADSMELEVKAFNKNGEFLHAFGREGQGPGEFQTIDDICWSRKTNFLYIADRQNQRISWFSGDGQFRGSEKTNKFQAHIEGINSLDDGRFVLTARVSGEREGKYKIIVTGPDFKEILAEIEEEFPVYAVGATISPPFSDVGTLPGKRIYYTSPSAYKITVLNSNFQEQVSVRKSHPLMHPPHYVKGFYVDFNAVESLLPFGENYLVGVRSTDVKKIPEFKEKRDLIQFVYKDNLREWDLKTPYQIDFYDKDFQFLKSVDIPDNRRLRGIDSSERVYFIENEPFPRIIRSRVTVKDKS